MADEKKIPLMANRGQTPYIPTGYEGLQNSVQRKRKVADALMAQGMQGPGPGARSWAQLLGSLAQTWAGKSIQKDADKEEASITEKIKAEVAQANQSYETLISQGADDETILKELGSNQWLAPRLKPHEEAFEALRKNKQEFGAPTEMKDAQGNFVTAQINKAGDIRQAPGGFGLPPVLSDINGVATALQRQADGTILPQNLTDSVIRGPDGKPVVNQDALDAKIKVAAAGAPNSQVTVHTGKELAAEMATMLTTSFNQAEASIATLGAADRIEAALNTGKASTGPWTNWKNYAEKVLGVNKEGVTQRRAIEQGIAQLGVDARKVLEGQGAVSNSEAEAVSKAYAGNIDEMTEGEIRVVIAVARRGGKAKIDGHNRQLEAAARVPGAEVFIPSFELPEQYRSRKAVPKPRTPQRGLPPKGASAPATKPAAKPPSRYQSLLPPPAGAR